MDINKQSIKDLISRSYNIIADKYIETKGELELITFYLDSGYISSKDFINNSTSKDINSHIKFYTACYTGIRILKVLIKRECNDININRKHHVIKKCIDNIIKNELGIILNVKPAKGRTVAVAVGATNIESKSEAQSESKDHLNHNRINNNIN